MDAHENEYTSACEKSKVYFKYMQKIDFFKKKFS